MENRDESQIEAILAGWPELNRDVVKTVRKKYGPPSETGTSMLVWHTNGPWKRTVVHAEVIEHRWPNEHHDVVEQFIDYRVPPDRASELAMFDGSVTEFRTRGELSAMCEGEEANFLALNLAHEILTEGLSLADARSKYEAKAKIMAAKQSDPYLDGLLFEVPHGGTADPDRTPPNDQ